MSKPMPHSEECERAALAAVIVAPRTAEVLASSLSPDDFYVERHRVIYECILELYEDGVTVDFRSLQHRLELRQKFSQVGGMAYLAGLDCDLPDLGRLDNYVEIIKERATRRRLIRFAQKLQADAFDGSLDTAALVEESHQYTLGLSAHAIPSGFVDLEKAMLEIYVQSEEQAASGSHFVGTPTGIDGFDLMVGGMVPGNLLFVGGRPGMGKTAIALNLMHGLASRGHDVVDFSLEMTWDELLKKLVSIHAEIPYSGVRNGALSEGQWAAYSKACEEIGNWGIFLDDNPAAKISYVESAVRRLTSTRDIKAVFVDYLQLMSESKDSSNQVLELGSISRRLKQLAKSCHTTVVCLSQLSRSLEHREDKRPVMSDLRGSGNLEQDADVVSFVYRDEVYNEDDPDVRGHMEWIVRKHRNGKTGTIDLWWQGEYQKIRDRIDGYPNY